MFQQLVSPPSFEQIDKDKSGFIDPNEFSDMLKGDEPLDIKCKQLGINPALIDNIFYSEHSESCGQYQPNYNLYGKYEAPAWYENGKPIWDPNNLWAKYSNQDYLGLFQTWKMSKAEFSQMMKDYGMPPAIQSPAATSGPRA